MTSVGQSSEQPVGLKLVSHRERQGKALEARLPFDGIVRMAGGVDSKLTCSVASVNDEVSFNGTAKVTLGFDASSIHPNENRSWGEFANRITQPIQTKLVALFTAPLPSVNTFAVSNLMFPGKNILDFKSVYLPGDLVIFGDVTTPGVVVDPPSVILGLPRPSSSRQRLPQQ